MKEYIKKFDTASAADNYPIADIPFITSVATNPVQNLVCNESGKKLVSVGGIIVIQSTGPVIPNNEIWYTTTDGEIYDLSLIIERLVFVGGTYNGPAVVSNEYDEEIQMWRMTFDDDVTLLGDIYMSTKTADGPFFVTYQEYGLACNVETIILPKTITSIGDLAFLGCTGLTSVTIPNSVTSIGDAAFASCTGLTSFEIPNSVTSIGSDAFQGCTGLTSFEIPNSVTSIGDYAFRYCAGLSAVTIGNSVTSIGAWAFDGCSGLTSVTIPNNVTSIGNDAFYDCVGLTSVVCEALIPPTCGKYAFDNTNDCPIYVPSQSVDAYKGATNWSTYASRIQASVGATK